VIGMRRLVLPGELISRGGGRRIGQGVLKDEEGLRSCLLGLLDEKGGYLRVIPLAGRYNPKEDDFVVGIVTSSQGTYWRVHIASPYSAILPAAEYLRELRGYERLEELLPPGSTVYARIKEVTRSKGVFLSLKARAARVLKEGTVIEISSSKVPRVIGKKDSMINMLRKESGCDILAGQNGLIWMNGPAEMMGILAHALRHIEAHSHRSGLTDQVKKMIIEKRSGT